MWPLKATPLLIAVFLLSALGTPAVIADPSKNEWKLEGKKLQVAIGVPDLVDHVEVEIISNRNANISSRMDVSNYHPNPQKQLDYQSTHVGNIWYPVVDVAIENGMQGELYFNKSDTGYVMVNGPYFKGKEAIEQMVVIPPWKLLTWENLIFVNNKAVEAEAFLLRNKYPSFTKEFRHTFELLTDRWSGTIKIYGVTNGEKELLDSKTFAAAETGSVSSKSGELTSENLLNALDATINYLQKSQIKGSSQPSEGGIYMYYDLDAEMYRTAHWSWWWGPAISLFLDAKDRYPNRFEAKTMETLAREVGEASLNFIWRDRMSELDGALISSWKQNTRFNNGFAGSIIIADALFLAGWGWMPLFQLTGDSIYMKATLDQCSITNNLLDSRELIPHSFHIEDNEWYDWYLNEFGFGVEGFAGIYGVLGEEEYRELGKKYIDRYRKYFEREDGTWYREFDIKTRQPVNPNFTTVRGAAWAVEGMIAAERLLPGEGYVEKGKKMADEVLASQLEDGSWPHSIGGAVEKVGVSEKGTAIWSYFLYKLYSQTGEEVYLNAARNALSWCLGNMYFGPKKEALGGIVGISPDSGISYRGWYPMTCSYTSVFLGLAILEELTLIEE